MKLAFNNIQYTPLPGDWFTCALGYLYYCCNNLEAINMASSTGACFGATYVERIDELDKPLAFVDKITHYEF